MNIRWIYDRDSSAYEKLKTEHGYKLFNFITKLTKRSDLKKLKTLNYNNANYHLRCNSYILFK